MTSCRPQNVFSSIKSVRVYQQIATQIERAILERRLQSGQKLPPERDLASRFGASRVAVREALRSLQLKGLLEVRKGAAGGYFVKRPHFEVVKQGLRTLAVLGECTVYQLTEVRLAIEPEVARLAAERGTPEDHQALTDLLKTRAAAERNGQPFGELDLEFHTRLAAASHNPVYVFLLHSLMELELEFVVGKYPFESEDHASVERAHPEILNAIIRRDGDLAADLMRQHILDLLRRMSRPTSVASSPKGVRRGRQAAK